MVIVVPIGLAVGAILLALWVLFTITGIGPLYHHMAKKHDEELLASYVEVSDWGATITTTRLSSSPLPFDYHQIHYNT